MKSKETVQGDKEDKDNKDKDNKDKKDKSEDREAEGMCIGMSPGLLLGTTGVCNLATGISPGMLPGLLAGMCMKKQDNGGDDMETIKIYLENMFRAFPQTGDVLRMKEELLGNMTERYRELKVQGRSENEAVGAVISEFGDINALMGLDQQMKEVSPYVDEEEARAYVEASREIGNRTGMGVGLIMVGVSLLVFLSQLFESLSGVVLIGGIFSSGFLDSLPIVLFFICLAAAVMLFISVSPREKQYKKFKKGRFILDPGTRVRVEEWKDSFQQINHMMTVFGVGLCVACPIPVLIGSAFGALGSACGVSLLLVMIALGVNCFIRSGEVMDAYKNLLKKPKK